MSSNSEKTSGILGLVVSLLLHGIFFAGCIAIDFTFHPGNPDTNLVKSEINKSPARADLAKVKS